MRKFSGIARLAGAFNVSQEAPKDFNSGSWEPLEGKFTRAGTQYQQPGEPVYDGLQSDWILEEVNLQEPE